MDLRGGKASMDAGMEAHFHAVSEKMQRAEEQLSHMQQVIETFWMALDDQFEQLSGSEIQGLETTEAC